MGSTSVLMKEAEASISSGDWDQAIESLEALREQNVLVPISSRRTSEVYSKLTKAMAVRGRFLSVLSLYLEWAASALESDDLLQAEETLGFALALRPDSLDAHELGVRIARLAQDKVLLQSRLTELAFLHLESGVAERSVELLSEAIECAPQDPDLPLQLAELQVSVGQIKAGIRQYEVCLKTYLEVEDIERSIKALRSLKLLKSDDVETLLTLGRTYLKSERIDDAELEFRAILKLDIENKEALLELAKVSQMQGRFRNGILALNKVLQLEADSALAHQRMGELHLVSGEKAKGLESLLGAAQLNLDQGDKERAAEVFKAVFFVDRDNQSAINGLVGLGVELPEPMMESPTEVEEVAEPEPMVEIEVESCSKLSDMETPKREKVKKRRALTRKSEFQGQKFKSKAFFKRKGEKLEEEPAAEKKPRLRAGLGLKDHKKPFLVLRRTPEPEEVVVEEPLVEEAQLPRESVSKSLVQDFAPLPKVGPLSAEEKVDVVPAFEDVFDIVEPSTEPELEPDAEVAVSLDEPLPTIVGNIFDFGQLEDDLEPSQVEPSLPTPVSADWDSVSVGELDFDSIFKEVESEEPEETEDWTSVALEDLDIGNIFEPEKPEDSEEREEAEESVEMEDRPEVVTSKSLEQEPIEELDFSSIFDEVALDFPDESENPIESAEAESVVAPKEAVVVPEEEAVVPEEEIDAGGLFPEFGFSDIFEGFDLNTEDETPSYEELDQEDAKDSQEHKSVEVVVEDVEQEVQVEVVSLSLAQEPEIEVLDFEKMRDLEISRLEPIPSGEGETSDMTELLAGTLPVTEPVSAAEPEHVVAPVEEIPEILVLEQERIEIELQALIEPEIVLEPCDIGTLILDLGRELELTPGDERKRLKMAESCLSYGLLETAIDQFQTLRKLNPGSVEIISKLVKTALWMEDYAIVQEGLSQLASLHFDSGDLSRCQERLGDLLSLNPEHKEGRMLMVDVFLLTDQSKLAAWHLGQMAERWLQEKEFESAITALQRLIEISPSTRASERLARLYETEGRSTEALEVYRQLSTHFESEESWDEAVNILEKMVSLDGSHVERERLIALYHRAGCSERAEAQQLILAQTLRERREFDRATAVLTEVLSCNAECFEAEKALVFIYLESGELKKAESHAEILAERFSELKSYDDAVELFESWVRVAPSSSRTRERLAQFYQLKGDLDGAKLEWILVTETHKGQGDFERAALSLERALELEPGQREWRLNLAQLKVSELQCPEQALPHLRELFLTESVASQATELYFQILGELSLMSELGEALGRLENSPQSDGLRKQTMEKLESRMAANPDDLELRSGWGELCLGLGLLDLAIEQFQRLRKEPKYRFHAYRLLGLCFAKKPGFNMLDLAISQFRKGLSLEEQSTEDVLLLRYQLSQILREHGRDGQALEQLRACFELRADYEDVEAQIKELEQ